ncbi:hypothetical protein L6258_01210 [Candidatus Parcubacteria bacterium]|nr:hypothetical protein [Candidatus Parcubacteria bacterium]
MIERMVESWTVWYWIGFYLIGSIIAGPMLVKFVRWDKRKTRHEYPGGGWLLLGLAGSWLVLITMVLIILLAYLVCLIQNIAGRLDKLAKHIP